MGTGMLQVRLAPLRSDDNTHSARAKAKEPPPEQICCTGAVTRDHGWTRLAAGNDKCKLVFILKQIVVYLFRSSSMPVYGMQPTARIIVITKLTPLLVLFMQSVNAKTQEHKSHDVLITPSILQDESWILQHMPVTSYDELTTRQKALCLLQW